MTESDFIETLCADARGEAWCCNLILLLLRAPEATGAAVPVLGRAVVLLQDEVRAKSRHPLADIAYRAVISATKDVLIEDTIGWRQPFSIGGPSGHITTYQSLRDHHFHLSEGLAKSFLSSTKTHAADRERWLREAVDTPDAPLRAREDSRFALNRLWLAPPEDSLPADGRNRASIERDRRGLVHYTSDDLLVHYSFRESAGAAACTPTVFDAVGRRFLALSAGHTAHPWGAAVDLQKFAGGEEDVDGLNESVVPPPSASLAHLHEIQVLGSPGLEAEPIGIAKRGLTQQDDDAAFLAFVRCRLPHLVGASTADKLKHQMMKTHG